MKPIKIVAENTTKIESMLQAANGRSTTHAYTTFGEIKQLAVEAEIALGYLMSKKDFSGAIWVESSGSPVANSYRGVRNGTRIRIQRRSSAWYLTEIEQVPLFKNGGGRGQLYLTVTQDVAAHNYLAKKYNIISSR